MTGQFADASYYLALLNADDQWHRRAVEVTASIDGPMVTTTWVLTEVADAFCRVRHRQRALELIRDLRSDPRVRIIEPSMDLFDEGLMLYGQRPDKDWSLTDCISFAVMRKLGLSEALTADHHFEQAGFVALLAASAR